MQSFIHDREKLAKQHKDGMQDDKNARELTNMLPEAFLWKVVSDDGERVKLHFEPNPGFSPPDMQSRVLGDMVGEMVVDKKQHRIVTLSGRLVQDVTIGWGLLGRLHEGGTFRVERREVAPGLWQITETHVHIQGRVLFFKDISQEQDEVQSEFMQVPNGTDAGAGGGDVEAWICCPERAGDRDGEVMTGSCMLGDDGTESLSAE